MRDRVIGPPPSSSFSCQADGCPLPAGCGTVCFVHDGLAPMHWAEATAAVHRLEKVFALSERMSNASPGEPVPDATIAAIKARGLPDSDTLPTRSCRQYAQGLRSILRRLCRPVVEVPRIADRMRQHGLVPIEDLLPDPE